MSDDRVTRMAIPREPDCRYCGGKTPPDNPPVYYTHCVHDELCPSVWAWRLGNMCETIPVQEYVKNFADYIRRVKESARG